VPPPTLAAVASPSLGLDITSIGVITSIFPLCYGRVGTPGGCQIGYMDHTDFIN
jgi:hypothetical protein